MESISTSLPISTVNKSILCILQNYQNLDYSNIESEVKNSQFKAIREVPNRESYIMPDEIINPYFDHEIDDEKDPELLPRVSEFIYESEGNK